MTFDHYIKSYTYFVSTRIKFFKLFRKKFKNYFSVLYHVLRKNYPIEGITRNGESIMYNQYSEIYYAILNIDHNSKENSITISPKHSSKKIKLLGVDNSGDIPSIYVDEEYSFLPVKEKIVIDIGSNIGDSAIYFCLRGAQKVIGLDPYQKNYNFALKNIEINGLSKNVEILLAGCSNKTANVLTETEDEKNTQNLKLITLDEILKIYNITNAILKIDCEGCEYDIILSTPDEILRKFTHIQIEYHYGYKNLKTKLEKCGFMVSVTAPKFVKSFNYNASTVSINYKNNSSNYIMTKKPINPKMFVGWLYATKININ